MIRNLYAVLVHERPDCVLDLVRNLHHLDPSSTIVLYNGGTDPELLRSALPWDRFNAVVHPKPRPLKWGWLHDFALDCMRFGFEQASFDTLTVVDSDQLALRCDYSDFLGAWLAGKGRVGLLGSAPPPTPGKALAPPAAYALKELDLWRPFLRRFERGEQKFVHWTFWPSTVFTADAARALLELWPHPELSHILARTKIWASEEVILPTLVALLGFEVVVNPCRHDYVRYRVRYTNAQLDAGMAHASVFWAHPIPRQFEHPLRAHVRARHGGYAPPETPNAPLTASGVMPLIPLLGEIRSLEGWLSDEEADLLVATATRALAGDAPQRIVEIGSHCGKATVALGRVAEARGSEARVSAIDPHDGWVGAHDNKLSKVAGTLDKLRENLARAGLSARVDVHVARSHEVRWHEPIALLVVDGLHDYASVAADFRHFEQWVAPGGYVAFHDYADYFPGVVLFVDELLASGGWLKVRRAGALFVLRRDSAPILPARTARQVRLEPPAPLAALDGARALCAENDAAPSAGEHSPRITCIMPTGDRRAFVALAIRHFLSQSYGASELVIVDDGAAPIHDLVPESPRVRCLRLERKTSVGEKRNVACQAARGAFIAHFDDDDWSSPERLSLQLAELEQSGAALAGLMNVYHHEPASGRAWEYRYPPSARRWVAGNTLFYRRELWARRPFEHINVGEDARFVWADRTLAIHYHASSDFFVAMVHATNVSKKRVGHRFFRPIAPALVRRLLGAEFETYRSLTGTSG